MIPMRLDLSAMPRFLWCVVKSFHLHLCPLRYLYQNQEKSKLPTFLVFSLMARKIRFPLTQISIEPCRL